MLHCINCAKCIGFHAMENHESPKTLFELLYTRWLDPPKLVIYDNSCHAHAYFLNREPQWAKDITFLIDKTHFKGHTGCSLAYDIGRYPKYGLLNSQLAEQKNSRLAILKKSCAYMTNALFLIYIRFFLYLASISPV